MSNPSEENKSSGFKFEISLSVLNHLGRNLYRSFVTVLGEAVSNAWDAEAKNVWISVDRERSSFVIKDDGDGMTADDFQKKFLKIGYSKRKAGGDLSPGGRPYIGRKGIGKLALLSCADTITVMSKVEGGDYVGGVIENKGLDEAITQDLAPEEYPLLKLPDETVAALTEGHDKGTIIFFQGVKSGIKNTPDYLKKIIALYFRFSLLDEKFNVYIDGEKITHEHIKDLAERTEFLWKIGDLKDPYVDAGLTTLKEQKPLVVEGGASGFIASVILPRDLNITGTGERVSIDLFVNGRLREKDVLKHMPTARIAESYLYGQIHLNDMDVGKDDRFTTSRESVKDDDEKYKDFLDKFKKAIEVVIKEWDAWRLKHREDGNPEDESVSKRDRKSMELFNAVAEDFVPPKDAGNKKLVDEWVDGLLGDASYNFTSYAECFISENLIRNLIEEKKIALSPEAEAAIKGYRDKEAVKKTNANISIDLRREDKDLSYLDMDGLANLVDKKVGDPNCLAEDAKQYKPMRDAVMHTALLSEEAKRKLTSVYDNVRARAKRLLFGKP